MKMTCCLSLEDYWIIFGVYVPRSSRLKDSGSAAGIANEGIQARWVHKYFVRERSSVFRFDLYVVHIQLFKGIVPPV
jgi:hypothetical protein